MKLIIFIVSVLMLSSCGKYLDIKPNKSMSIPNTLSDLRLLLDNDSKLNRVYPSSGEVSSDNLYVSNSNWMSLTRLTDRNLYIWNDDIFNDNFDNDWSRPYTAVFTSNVILEGLNTIQPNHKDMEEWKEIKGGALFFRALAFHTLASHFGQPYDIQNADEELGIPLRLKADINDKSIRATVSETFDRIIADLEESIELLPEKSLVPSRPTKAASFGLLARVFLDMGNFDKATLYASKCLQVNSQLIDFNQLDNNQVYAIQRNNTETIFWSVLASVSIFGPNYARIHTDLYESYDTNDLRKRFYARKETDGNYSFVGSFDGSSSCFNGISVGEMLLIRAECSARSNQLPKALDDLNYLLVNRYKQGEYVDIVINEADEVLMKVLEERRKELVFRGLRWADLRRLNKDQKTATTINRKVDNIGYVLEPNSRKYTFPIPHEVIKHTGMTQNKR